MKKHGRIASLLLVFTLVTALLAIPANAHEMFYSGSSPNYTAVSLKWNDIVSSKANLKINGDYLKADYIDLYPDIRGAWSSASTKVSCVETSFSSSTVDLCTPTEAWWDTINPDRPYRIVYGFCEAKSTDNYILTSLAAAQASSGKIKNAAIYLTPYISDYDWALLDGGAKRKAHIKAVGVHEIGHVLGLGHPNVQYYPVNSESIMRTDIGYEGYWTPRSHDITDLTSKY